MYQLDEELKPILVRRGTKMVNRRYEADVVEAARARRIATAPAPGVSGTRPLSSRELDRAAANVVASRMESYADAAPFFIGVPPEETERVRERIRALARRLQARP